MGQQKIKYEQSKTQKIISVLFTAAIATIIVLGLYVAGTDSYEKTTKNIEYINSLDTLIISKDLGSYSNITAYVKEHYPNYNMISYKHVASDYSAWDGSHNFYEFILVKK